MDFGFLNSATNAVKSVTNFVSSGPAASLADAPSDIAGFFSRLVNAFAGPRVKLPIKNVLHDYASYTYILGLGCLSAQEANAPDATYMRGGRIDLICKSGGVDPANRVQTPYGKLDFFIDDLVIKGQMGLQNNGTSNVFDLEFKITEPYSMGLLVVALQIAARKKGYNNWRDAVFLLTIEFTGSKNTGQMGKIPGTFRCIPFMITDWNMSVNQSGAVYSVKGLVSNMQPFADSTHLLKNDATITGASVVELLQTGPNSLQSVLNERARLIASQHPGMVPDQYVITFPIDSSSSAGTPGATDNPLSAITSIASISDVTNLLGLQSEGTAKNTVLTQDYSQVNVIGKSIIDFDTTRPGDKPATAPDSAYDNKSGNFNKSKILIDPKQFDFKVAQESSITNAINQVLLKSKFIKDTFQPGQLSSEGYRMWWRIDPQTFIIDTNANDGITNQKPKVFVYRVIPYNTHASNLIGANLRAPGFDQLKAQAVKRYEYTYTGHNVDIRKFNFYLDNSYGMFLTGDTLDRSQDSILQQSQATKLAPKEKSENVAPLPEGNKVDTGGMPFGAFPGIVKFVKTLTGTDRKGGGGLDSEATRAARLWHDAVTNTGQAMQYLDMEIIGDPWYIAQSGMGNYTSSVGQVPNMKADGSINYQDGEVDIVVEFRTPVDINLQTGLYNFKGANGTIPLLGYSGLYRVTDVESRFQQGLFTQRIQGTRRLFQESDQLASDAQLFSTTREAPKGTKAGDASPTEGQ